MNNLLEKLKNLKKNDNNPFSINQFSVDCKVQTIIEKFCTFDKKKLEEIDYLVRIAGRIMRIRNFGSLSFAVLRTFEGDIQLISIKNNSFQNLDIGDIVGVSGTVCKTDKGELSIKVNDFQLLSKCLKPIPDFHYGFSDIEERFRNRHLDFIVNKKSIGVIISRFKIINSLRQFLNNQNFI